MTPEEYAARCAAISAGDPSNEGSGIFNFSGGEFGAWFASIVCPLGYRREFHVVWGPVQRTDHYVLDFALPEAKINIELDGPYHDGSGDAKRDGRLRSLAWRVVRVRHD